LAKNGVKKQKVTTWPRQAGQQAANAQFAKVSH